MAEITIDGRNAAEINDSIRRHAFNVSSIIDECYDHDAADNYNDGFGSFSELTELLVASYDHMTNELASKGDATTFITMKGLLSVEEHLLKKQRMLRCRAEEIGEFEQTIEDLRQKVVDVSIGFDYRPE